jgi:ubiquinone/menaquinone biosynthesis C-methylase UbiE
MPTFKDLEFDTWQRGAAAYDRLFGAVTRAAIAPALDALQLSAGTRLLDVCCGTGHTVAAALDRGVAATGVDLAPQMLTLARRRAPSGTFVLGDAEALDDPALAFEPGSFDAACCLFGLNHLPDQERAVAQVLRLLRPGGRYALTMWCPPGASTFHALVQEAIASHGRTDLPTPITTQAPRLRYANPQLCSDLLLAAGFESPKLQELPLAFDLDSARTVLELAATSPRVSLLLAQQSASDRRRIEEAIVEGALAYRRGDRIQLPIPALLVVARSPA